jgi:hypothetical protein
MHAFTLTVSLTRQYKLEKETRAMHDLPLSDLIHEGNIGYISGGMSNFQSMAAKRKILQHGVDSDRHNAIWDLRCGRGDERVDVGGIANKNGSPKHCPKMSTGSFQR